MEMGQVGRACTSLSAAAPCNTDAARLAQRMAKRGVATAEAVWAGKEVEREQGVGRRRRRRRRERRELRPALVAAGAGFQRLEHAATGASAAIAGPWVIARAGGGDAEVAEEGAQCGAVARLSAHDHCQNLQAAVLELELRGVGTRTRKALRP
jgi:hypothetical protein